LQDSLEYVSPRQHAGRDVRSSEGRLFGGVVIVAVGSVPSGGFAANLHKRSNRSDFIGVQEMESWYLAVEGI
jgi:hypothetical protein